MNHLDALKQLKNISPEEGYVRKSRLAILSSPIFDTVPTKGIWDMFMHSLQFGSSVALAGVLLILVLGGFSTWREFSPFRLASLDPASLKAEAEAIDVQLEMTNIQYAETPTQIAAPLMQAKSILMITEDAEDASIAEEDMVSANTAKTETTIGLEEALGILSE